MAGRSGSAGRPGLSDGATAAAAEGAAKVACGAGATAAAAEEVGGAAAAASAQPPGGEPAVPATGAEGGGADCGLPGSLHVSSKDFVRCPPHAVEQFLQKASPVRILKFFKIRQWGFAFVTVAPEDSDAFRTAVHGAKFRKSEVEVRAGRPRREGDPNGQDRGRACEGGNGDDQAGKPAKRRKLKEFPEGYTPTLKDLKDRERNRKREVEASVLQKTAPLFDWPYETQLSMKGTYVKSAVRSITKAALAHSADSGLAPPAWTTPEWSLGSRSPVGCCCPLDPIISTPAECLDGYRNKCEFTIGHTEEGDVECGFVLRVTQEGGQVVDSVKDSPHTPLQMKRLCGVIREIVKASPFTIFDRKLSARNGIWRLVMARLSPMGEMLVLIQVASLPDAEREGLLVKSLVEGLTENAPDGLNVTSIYLQINDAPTDAARPDAPLKHVHGKERLVMTLLGLNFKIGPMSFFQANSATCVALYKKALEWVRPEGILFDICCGVGTIGLCAARHCQQVIGLELVPEAVESARANAALNDIGNATYYVGKAEDTLPEVLNKLGEDAEICAVVDPPRPGLHKTVLSALRSCAQLARLVYISCNPDSLVEDVVKLTAKAGDAENDAFVPVRAVAVDMFPHTLHCEMILLLERASRVADPRGNAAAVALERAQAAAAGAGEGQLSEGGDTAEECTGQSAQ